MFKRPIFAAFSLAIGLMSLSGFVTAEHIQVSFFGKQLEAISGVILIHPVRVDPTVYKLDPATALTVGENAVVGKSGQWSYCDYSLPENPTYDVELISTDVDENIQSGSVFMVNMTFKNKGNTRIFSSKSTCEGMPVFNLGTAGARDRSSMFGKSSVAMSGWTSANRIKMMNDYADPEQEFNVMFQSIAPEGDNIYKEWFQPLVENVSWLSSPFSMDINVGTPSAEMFAAMEFVKNEMAVAAGDLVGKEKSFLIDLSDQTMAVKFGDVEVWKFLISSGAYATPTPTGSFPIFLKQELRIGGAWPHYRMPYFMMWRKDGYGIHALPYLATDGGTFWNEALDHIGKPVSHGCVRVLPDDASMIYDFAEIGTVVNIQA